MRLSFSNIVKFKGSEIIVLQYCMLCCKSISSVTALGVIFDQPVNLQSHVNNVCKSSYYTISVLSATSELLSRWCLLESHSSLNSVQTRLV